MGRGFAPALLLLVGASAPNPGCFAAARPGGHLSLTADAAVLLGFIVGKQTFDVLPVDQQLTLPITQGAVLGIGSTLFSNESVELGVQVFDLRQLFETVVVEVSLRLAAFFNVGLVLVVELS